MPPRAESRELRAALVLGVCFFTAVASAADTRQAPLRPAAAAPARKALPSLPGLKISGVEYVSVADIAKQLNLKGDWTDFRLGYELTAKNTKIQLDPDGRRAGINGIGLYLGNPVVQQRGQLYVSRIDYEHSIMPRVRPDLVATRPPAVRVIAIDAGHGGPDDGTSNQKLGLREKDITIDIAQRVRELAIAAGYTVVMTRENDNVGKGDDEFRRRAAVVNKAGADIMVSIHLNQDKSPKTGGTETYVFTPATQWSTDALAAKDLAAKDAKREKNPKGDDEPNAEHPDPSPANRYDAWSGVLSQAMQREVGQALKTTDRGQKTKHSAILRNIDCPSVLVESLFLSSETEGPNVAKPEYRQKIAEAIFAGIKAYETAASL